MEERIVHEGRWLHMGEKLLPGGRKWEYVRRAGQPRACVLVALTAGEPPSLVLIRQQRPPVERAVLEFPAGLVEEGESVEEAAVRELAEETGYTGEVIETGPTVYSSPGLTDESVCWVRLRLTGKGSPRPDEGEEIEVLEVPLPELMGKLEEHITAGDGIDAKLWFFARARVFA